MQQCATTAVGYAAQGKYSKGSKCLPTPSLNRSVTLTVFGRYYNRMESLTIGRVSGGIAAAVVVVQFILPNVLVLLLVAALSDRHTAVTWSVAGRQLFTSQWPLFLRSDTVALRAVHRPIQWIALIRPLSLFLVAIAAIVTPMGLYESVDLSSSPSLATFSYAPDTGVMGQATMPRSDVGFSRTCVGDQSQSIYPCPGTRAEVVHETILNDSLILTGYPDPRIGYDVAELYQSGCSTQARTVSSFFDIECRIYAVSNSTYRSDTNVTSLLGSYKRIRNFVLEDSIEVVEGLIVDSTQTPKIGFRNHTVPVNVQVAAEWEEDILFMEPETVCVNTNLTYESIVPLDAYSTPVYLVDHGGFAQLNKTSPWPPEWWSSGNIQQPSLEHRAYSSAWYYNVLMMAFFDLIDPMPQKIRILSTNYENVTINSTLNQRWSVGDYNTGNLLYKNTLHLDATYRLPIDSFASAIPDNSTSNDTTPRLNPLHLQQGNFSDIGTLCQGFGGGDLVNFTNVGVVCGMMFGTPRFRGDGSMVSPQMGSGYSRPLYSCSSATKISIKSVRFRYNATTTGSPGLENLEVMTIRDKIYATEADMPLWGAETPDMNISMVNQLWGLISDDRQGAANLTTVRAPAFYVHPSQDAMDYVSPFSDYVPGSEGPAAAWTFIYQDFGSGVFSGISSDGESDLAVANKWSNLSQTERGAAEMMNLLFTDYAANIFVGTKSQTSPAIYLPPNLQPRLTKRAPVHSTDPGQVFVYQYHQRVRYRWVFGIPALICIAICGIAFATALGVMVLGKGTPARIRHYLYNLSPGRLLASKVHGNEGDQLLASDTRSWISVVGSKPIGIRRRHSTSGVLSRHGSTKYQPVHGEEPSQHPQGTDQSGKTHSKAGVYNAREL